jgi:predicted nucleotidyltransferase
LYIFLAQKLLEGHCGEAPRPQAGASRQGLNFFILCPLTPRTARGLRGTIRSSDIDIGMVIKTTPTGRDTRAIYNILYRLFSDLYRQFKLDIVFLQTATLSLQYSAIKEGKVIFEEDPRFTADYENRVINQYLDFRPVLDFFDRVTMERYGKA